MKNCRNIIAPRRDIVDVITSPPRSVPASRGMDSKPQHAAQRPWTGAAAGKVVERVFGHADDVVADEGRALARAVLRVLQAALPLQHRPAPEVVLRELREDRLEIDLPVAERAEAAGTVDPVLVAAIHAAARIGTVFGVLDVEHADARVVPVNEAQV